MMSASEAAPGTAGARRFVTFVTFVALAAQGS
jgi:hypothetical protein